MSKPILCLDFDGVCHSYDSGWKGETIIPDDAVPGLFEFLEQAVKHFDIQVYSTRSRTPDGRDAMAVWFYEQCKKWRKNGGKGDGIIAISFPENKPSAFVSIDDRAITFDGRWPDVETLQNFKPWNKGGKTADQLSASEALYGFMGWLTCLDKPVKFSSRHEAGIAAELVDEFCKANNLESPLAGFSGRFVYPTSRPLLDQSVSTPIPLGHNNRKFTLLKNGDPVEWFSDSPGAGHPDCICSYCGLVINEEQAPPIRLFEDENNLEARFHLNCWMKVAPFVAGGGGPDSTWPAPKSI